jgi:hypothetical protein
MADIGRKVTTAVNRSTSGVRVTINAVEDGNRQMGDVTIDEAEARGVLAVLAREFGHRDEKEAEKIKAQGQAIQDLTAQVASLQSEKENLEQTLVEERKSAASALAAVKKDA